MRNTHPFLSHSVFQLPMDLHFLVQMDYTFLLAWLHYRHHILLDSLFLKLYHYLRVRFFSVVLCLMLFYKQEKYNLYLLLVMTLETLDLSYLKDHYCTQPFPYNSLYPWFLSAQLPRPPNSFALSVILCQDHLQQTSKSFRKQTLSFEV